ncbi:MAG: hypothetical protein ACFFD4_01125 [Candidatus Odinarchaeota archaeon]
MLDLIQNDAVFYTCLFGVEIIVFLLAFAAFVKFVLDYEARGSKSMLFRSLLAESALIVLFGFPPENLVLNEFEGVGVFIFEQVIINLAIWSVMGFIFFFIANLGYLLYYSVLDDNIGTLHSKKRIIKLVGGTGLLLYFLWFLGGWSW